MATPIEECHARAEDAMRVLKLVLADHDPVSLQALLRLASHHIDSALIELGRAFGGRP